MKYFFYTELIIWFIAPELIIQELGLGNSKALRALEEKLIHDNTTEQLHV